MNLLGKPIKFDSWHISGAHLEYEAGRYPILDWSAFYAPKHIEYKYNGVLQSGFTGRYWKIFSVRLYLFRHEFGFRIEWNFGQMSSEEAYAEYHGRFKK